MRIIPIFVDLEKAIVYNEIPWLDGIAFEKCILSLLT